MRNAPLYQQYPKRQISDAIWQRIAGFLYAVKMQINLGRHIRLRLRRLRQLEGTCKGKRAMVIANGPSSNDLTEFQIKNLIDSGFEFIVMNDFYKNNRLSSQINPSYYCLGDPYYLIASENFSNFQNYFNAHLDCVEVRPATLDDTYLFSRNALYYNPIPGAGFTRRFTPLHWRAYPDGILFVALCLAKFLGYSTVYVIGAENSMYKHHYFSSEMRIKHRISGLHSYQDDIEETETIPFITRSMSDVLFAHARFLEDLKRLCSHFAINVGQSDETNDALPKACLLPKKQS